MFLHFFEDHRQPKLDPLTLTRPVDDLRVGILTIREKWLLALQTDQWTRTLRDHLHGVWGQTDSEGERYYINSRYLPSSSLIKIIGNLSPNEALVHGDEIIAVRSPELDPACLDEVEALPSTYNRQSCPTDINIVRLQHLWDLFLLNGPQIQADIELLSVEQASLPEYVIVDHENEVYVDPTAHIEPGVTIITEGKPVYIGPNAHVMAGSILRGPLAICERAVIKSGAKIYGKTSIGPVCKVGGEINNCIFHSYSNKGHDGFVGNSLFGQWCNLGADTNTSNLKNNYSPVRLTDWHSGESMDTGQQFIGTIMGDHSKTAINTMLNTGTICGVSSNIFSSGFPPKYIPSFSWMGGGERQLYRFDKAVETMERMMARRDVELTADYQRMMQQILVMESGRRTTDDG